VASASRPVGVSPSASVRLPKSVLKTGGWLTLVTVQVNESVAVRLPSETVMTVL
jgi:hypothetical protein